MGDDYAMGGVLDHFTRTGRTPISYIFQTILILYAFRHVVCLETAVLCLSVAKLRFFQ